MAKAQRSFYDVVVIGAGSAGCVVAARLSEDETRSVLLVEAGPDYPDLETLPADLKYGYASATHSIAADEHLWQFTACATGVAPPLKVPRGRVVGGSSAVNGQVFLRALPEDYDGWRAGGCAGWAYADVVDDIVAIESDLDFPACAGPIPIHRYGEGDWLPGHRAFHRACRDAGHPNCPDANAPDTTGVGPYPLNNPGFARISTAIGYLAPARGRSNLEIVANAMVHKVLVEDSLATGVDVEIEGKRFEIAARETILCAGAIGSPHLLMLSGVGPTDQLKAAGVPVVVDSPGVGKDLQDHPMVPLRWRVKPAYGVGIESPLAQMLLRYTAHDSTLRNDMWIGSLALGDEFHLYAGLHAPASRGELRLASPDIAIQPELDYRYASDVQDSRRLSEAVTMALQLARHRAVQEIIDERLSPGEADEVSLDWILREVTTAHHVCGTCKMGPASDRDAVVGPDGRVHGLAGLRVADASIMPTIVRANTNPATILIGERIARLMRNT